MKIASVFAAMPGDQSGLLSIKNIVSGTLTDLGIEPEEINLGYRSLPYYDGIKSEYMNTIADVIRESNGVIIYLSASFGLPGALMQTLLEHFSYPEYAGLMNDKNCFIIANCDDNTGAMAMSAMELAIYNIGAFSGAKILVDKNFTDKMEPESKNFILIEKLCEDYYRALRQQRVMYRPAGAAIQTKTQQQAQAAPVDEMKYDNNTYAAKNDEQKIQPVYDKKIAAAPVPVENFTESQQQDIEEISKFFAKKFKINGEDNLEFNETVSITGASSAPKTTLAQRTSALTHHYKAGQADGLKAVIALSISGKDGFEGHIDIDGADCDFSVGTAEASDVSIIAESGKWSEIIKGKTTAQKAFMVGQIKVRGNFVLLSKFDQLFDFGRSND